MPVINKYFTFDEKANFDSDMAFHFLKTIDKELHDRLLKKYKVKHFDADLLNAVLEELRKGESNGWDDGDIDMYHFVEHVSYNKELQEMIGFVKLDEDVDAYEGSDEYEYWEYKDTSSVIAECTSEINRHIETLKKYGKKVTFKVA